MSEVDIQMEVDSAQTFAPERNVNDIESGDDTMGEEVESDLEEIENEEDPELLAGIDQTQVLPERLRQGFKVDYSSGSAIARAGLSGKDENEEPDPDYVDPAGESDDEEQEQEPNEAEDHSMSQ